MTSDFPYPRAKYKYKAKKRMFEKAMALPSSQSQSMDTTDGPGPSQSQASASGGSSGGSKVEAPLRGFTVYTVGKLSKAKSALTRQIEDLGGRVVKQISQDVTICLSSESKSDEIAHNYIIWCVGAGTARDGFL